MLADCVVEPTRTRLARLQLVASPMCLYMIAARVSKPCGVVCAHQTHHLPAAYPPAQCSSLPWRRRVRKVAHTLSAPSRMRRTRRTRRTIGCPWRVSKWIAPHVLADCAVGPVRAARVVGPVCARAARVSEPRHRAHPARTACPPAHTRQSWCARLSPESIRLACRLRTACPPAQDVQQTESGPEKAARGVCALPRPPPFSACLPTLPRQLCFLS